MAENRFVYEGGSGEVVEKKSRFISNIYPVSSEEEAIGYIEKIKKQYWDARHNCYAYVIGDNYEVQRYSDDGEPQQTAGKPMLDVLINEKIHNALVIVTRYFGGTLLGTGGLIRAYQQATKEGLDNSRIGIKKKGVVISIRADYNDIGKIQYLAANSNITILSSEYADKVDMSFVVDNLQKEGFIAQLTELTAGKMPIDIGDEIDYALINDKIQVI